MLLIKNATVYTPSPIGIKDILICQGRIERIADHIFAPVLPCQILDASNLIAVPGFIDQHIHVTGGGGEGGFHTRTQQCASGTGTTYESAASIRSSAYR